MIGRSWVRIPPPDCAHCRCVLGQGTSPTLPPVSAYTGSPLGETNRPGLNREAVLPWTHHLQKEPWGLVQCDMGSSGGCPHDPATDKTNVVLVLKEDSFKKEIGKLEPVRTKAGKSLNTDVGKTAERGEKVDHNLDKTQCNAEVSIRQETPRMEAKEQQTSKQETLENKDNTEDAMALHRAAQEDDWKKVECLLQNGAQIEAGDEQNKTALFYAVAKGHEKTIKALLEAGAKVDSEIINETPLHVAAALNKLDIQPEKEGRFPGNKQCGENSTATGSEWRHTRA
uniref:Uncharacterized protein n=1 Tax=Neogobius melanostomus TaxID=47308 RepID=A0A8C6T4D1_9GOBI